MLVAQGDSLWCICAKLDFGDVLQFRLVCQDCAAVVAGRVSTIKRFCNTFRIQQPWKLTHMNIILWSGEHVALFSSALSEFTFMRRLTVVCKHTILACELNSCFMSTPIMLRHIEFCCHKILQPSDIDFSLLKNVRYLSLMGTKDIADESIHCMVQNSLPDLEGINLSKTSVTSSGIKILMQSIASGKLPRLYKITIYGLSSAHVMELLTDYIEMIHTYCSHGDLILRV